MPANCTFYRFLQFVSVFIGVLLVTGTPVDSNGPVLNPSKNDTEEALQEQQVFQAQWEGCTRECDHLSNLFCEKSMRTCVECDMYCHTRSTYYSIPDCKTICPAYFSSLQTTQSPTEAPTQNVSVVGTTNNMTKDGNNSSELHPITEGTLNKTTEAPVPAQRLIGKPRLKGHAWIIAVVFAFVVFIVGMLIWYGNVRQPVEKDNGQHTAKLPEQRRALYKIQHFDLCGIFNGNVNDDIIQIRGAQPVNDASASGVLEEFV